VSDRGFAFAKTLSENWIGRLGNMPEKLRLGTPLLFLLAFGESFCAAMDGTIVQKDPKIRIILIHITDARRGDCIAFMVRDFAAPSQGWRGAV
jgi:hypothetical protein